MYLVIHCGVGVFLCERTHRKNTVCPVFLVRELVLIWKPATSVLRVCQPLSPWWRCGSDLTLVQGQDFLSALWQSLPCQATSCWNRSPEDQVPFPLSACPARGGECWSKWGSFTYRALRYYLSRWPEPHSDAGQGLLPQSLSQIWCKL